jgi:prolyl-tRNA synthetase
METELTVKKEDDFNEWYQQVVLKGKMIMVSGVEGCYVLLPNSFHIWETIKDFLDNGFKKKGVRNAYFPLLIKRSNLEMESKHLEEFTPEVAWVGTMGHKDLADRDKLAIRPTSECGMYPLYAKMIRSHVDLPLKLNQWCNVFRCEFKDARPFIRTREILWQEGHSCHTTHEDADEEAKDILDLYKSCYRHLLAVPMIRGYKTEKETFAGADKTYTIEGFIKESGKGIQAATSHLLGENFAKLFKINYQSKDRKTKNVHQTSWGFTTRSIGVMIMTHSDNQGLVIPPLVAETQIVIVPVFNKKKELQALENYYYSTVEKQIIHDKSIYNRIYFDNSNKRPGFKYNYWEAMGVPLRIEIGKKEVETKTVRLCYRNSKKFIVSIDKGTVNLQDAINEGMIKFTEELYINAKDKMMNSLKLTHNFTEFETNLKDKNMCLVNWCGKRECEDNIKEKTGAKSLCIPMEDLSDFGITSEKLSDLDECLCSEKGDTLCIFGYSY